MIALLALVVVGVVAITDHRRRTGPVAPTLWLWLLAEVESHVDGTAVDPCDVVVGVCLHGPPPVRCAAEDAVRAHGGAPRAVLLGGLCDRLATAPGDRLCATAAAAAAGGVDPAAALARLRVGEVASADATCRARGTLRLGTAACWLLLSPLGLVGSGVITGGAAWVVAAGAVAAWWAGSAWVRAAVADARVLTGSSVHALLSAGSAAT
ncbi:MAG TPA: hypothetical protein VK923_17435 [Euzebyales bacterium]|nr:hypothetical protein [Euzebyales bacterium]